MDNLCHTLAGAALAQAGLKRRTPLATATLLIAANLPDVDVVSLAWGEVAGLSFRRGWTHGVLALVVLPVLLAAGMAWFDRRVTKRGARFGPLLALAALGVASHPLLDALNTYGVRWLMPFSDRWYYGDTLFVVDAWMWLVLGWGVLASRRRERRGADNWRAPARAALAFASVYAIGMFTLGRIASSQVRAELRAEGGAVYRVLASPLPLTPIARDIVVDEGNQYLVGRIRTGGSFEPEAHWPKRNPDPEMADPEVTLAAETPQARAFLRWARYPTYLVDRRGGLTVVHFIDLRYARHPDATFGTLAVPIHSAEATVLR